LRGRYRDQHKRQSQNPHERILSWNPCGFGKIDEVKTFDEKRYQ